MQCSAEGAATCYKGSRRWRFRLPVDDGRIDSLHVHARDSLVLVYSLTDEESSWGKAVAIIPRARRPLWETQVGGLNRAPPIASFDGVLVAALGFVALIDRATGAFEWRHEYIYDGSGQTDVNLQVRDGVVTMIAAVPWRTTDFAKTCFGLETGVVLPCPESPSRDFGTSPNS